MCPLLTDFVEESYHLELSSRLGHVPWRVTFVAFVTQVGVCFLDEKPRHLAVTIAGGVV